MLHPCNNIAAKVTIHLSDFVELRRGRVVPGAHGAPSYTIVVSAPDELAAVHLPSALPEYVNDAHKGVSCILCGHSSDDLGPLAKYRSTTYVPGRKGQEDCTCLTCLS